MTKEELMALDEEKRKEILSWLQETKVEQSDENLDTQSNDVDSQNEGETEGDEKSKQANASNEGGNDEQTEENGGEQETDNENNGGNDEKTNQEVYNAQEDIKKFGNDLKTLMDAQAETLKKYEELAKVNSELKAELEELKKTNLMGNYQFKPSDDDISKADKERDSFVDKYRNAYKN